MKTLQEDSKLANRVKNALNKELIRKLLEQYFCTKGLGPMDKIYPPSMQDIMVRIPDLAMKIEIIPYVKEINSGTGAVSIGWNLFVLGTNRMHLGISSHKNAGDLERAIFGAHAGENFEPDQCPESVIKFVTRILGRSISGKINNQQGVLNDPLVDPAAVSGRPSLGPTMSGGYYERNKPAG